MAKATLEETVILTPKETVILEMSKQEAEYLLKFIITHGVGQYGPVTQALYDALRAVKYGN